MKRLLTATLLYILVCVSLPTLAQRPRYEKLSPMLRELVKSRQVKSGERLLSTTTDLHNHSLFPLPLSPSQEVCAFIRVTDDAEAVFKRHHVRPVCHYGTLYVAMIPLGSLHGLSLEKSVARIEARQSNQLHMDSVVREINALPAHQGLNLPQAFTGRGVVMGVMDIGFDLTHPNFYSRDTTDYRIRAFWDQLSQDTVGSTFPVGRDYVTTADLLSLGHARDGLDMTHGTHTLGTAAGSGYDSPYRGIAPESDIVLVANAVTDDLPYIDSADVYKYTFATDALGFKYIFDQADRMGKPCVISFSEGSGQDFWGYDQLYYEMLDSLTGPGHIIVSSAGNQGRTKSWFRKPAGEPSMGTFLYRAASEMTVTLKSADHFALRFVSYSQPRDTLLVYTRDVVMNEDSTLTVSVHNDADNRLLLVQLTAYPSCYDASETCYDAQILTTKHVGDTPKLSLEVVGTSADVEVFRSTGYFTENAINPALNAGECVRNINSPSSSPSVICVGATIYRTGITNYKGNWRSYETGSGGQRMTATSVGPTFDGRVKPDVMAPGANVISSYSSFYLEHHPTAADIGWDVAHFPFNGRTYAWNSNSGTSMAAPAVGGAIALWLQANPRLTPDDVLSIIGRTSRHNDPSLDYPNNEWGHGEIDVYRGLIDVLGLTAVEPLSVTQSKAHISISHGRLLTLDLDAITSQPLRVRLYSLSGTLVADHQLQKGSSHYQVLLPPAIRGVIAVQLDGEAAIRGSQLIRVE